MIAAHVPLLATVRGRTIECVHYGSIAVCDRSGELIAAVGDIHALNFARSTLKPLQALPFIECQFYIDRARACRCQFVL